MEERVRALRGSGLLSVVEVPQIADVYVLGASSPQDLASTTFVIFVGGPDPQQEPAAV